MKLGKVSFNPEAIKVMSFEEFEALYKDSHLGCEVKEAYELLTNDNSGTNSKLSQDQPAADNVKAGGGRGAKKANN